MSTLKWAYRPVHINLILVKENSGIRLTARYSTWDRLTIVFPSRTSCTLNIPTRPMFYAACYNEKPFVILTRGISCSGFVVGSIVRFLANAMAHQDRPHPADAGTDNFDFVIRSVTIEEGSWGYLRSVVKDFLLHNTFAQHSHVVDVIRRLTQIHRERNHFWVRDINICYALDEFGSTPSVQTREEILYSLTNS